MTAIYLFVRNVTELQKPLPSYLCHVVVLLNGGNKISQNNKKSSNGKVPSLM
jgi:hypothetical protein